MLLIMYVEFCPHNVEIFLALRVTPSLSLFPLVTVYIHFSYLTSWKILREVNIEDAFLVVLYVLWVCGLWLQNEWIPRE